MWAGATSRLSYANVMATIAVFMALGGGAYAAFKLPKNSVGTKQLKNAAVTTKKIKNGAVTKSKINTSGLTVPNASNANNLGGRPASAYAAVAQPAYIAPTLNSGYTNFGSGDTTVGYMKDTLGFVHLKGTFNCPSVQGTAFTLPAGYRPSQNQFGAAISNVTGTDIEVLTDGEVSVGCPSGDDGIDGFVFPAAGTAGT